MEKEIRDTILSAMEQGLEAQLRAVRRLQKTGKKQPEARPERGKSQVDMAYDILMQSSEPLHITTLLERIHSTFGVKVDRESLVSSLTKKVARGDRFVRTGKNTFGLKEVQS
jgi:DNA-directed RNA polymerase delta subunit